MWGKENASIMETTYIQHLKIEQTNASCEFEQAKENAIQEIKALTPLTAMDFGADYVSHINKISRAAANLESITEAVNVYEYFENNKNET